MAETNPTKNVLNLFLLGKITLSKGAKLARMNIWDFASLVREQKLPWIKKKKFVEKDFLTKIQ